MKKHVALFVLVVSLILSSLWATDSNKAINFQGYLTDKNGQPVFGQRFMGFAVYPVLAGGTAIATPSPASSLGVRPVTIYNGNYSTKLEFTDAQLTAIGAAGSGAWLQVWVSTDTFAAADTAKELTPRVQLATVPFAANVRGMTVDNAGNVSITGNMSIGGGISFAGKVKESGSDLVPKGIIVMWSGAVNAIPAGWALCDGTNGTPDLRDRFIVGAGSSYAPSSTGGVNTMNLTVAQLPAHNHAVTDPGHVHAVTDPGHAHIFWGDDQVVDAVGRVTAYNWAYDATSTRSGAGGGAYTTSALTGIAINNNATGIALGNTGSGAIIDVRPKYFSLAYIMKL